MALVGSNVALNGPPFKTLCILPTKLGQTICTSLQKKSAAWQNFASGRIWAQRTRPPHLWEMEVGSVN